MQYSQISESAFLDESAAFVTMAWHELFNPRAPYSYRPRLYDTHGLIEELSFLANLALQDTRWLRHLELVQNELRWAANVEKFWLKENAWSRGIIQKISSAADMAQIEDLASVFVDTSPNPVERLFECLHREITTLPKNKENVITVLKLLGTQAIRRGLTVSDVALDSSEIYGENHIEIANRLQGLIEVESRPFNCVVQLHGNSSHIHSLFAQNGFRRANHNDFPVDKNGQDFKESFKESISRQTAYCYETEAISHLTASASAVQACRRVIDTFNLYRNRASIELDANILVVDSQRARIVSRQTEQSLATQPSYSARKLTRDALRHIQFNDFDSGLENSLEQHSLALSGAEQKASLVGIWTAFECLVGSDRRIPNVQRIVNWIAPIVALRRVDKITRYLAVCCHNYFSAISQHPNEQFSRSYEFYFSPRDLLDAITGPKDNDLVVQLLRDTSNHPLLRFRIYHAWQNFHKPKIVKRNLLHSRQNLNWHLERIYRARNLTVHQGKNPPFVSELVDHAQHYFTRCMTRVLSDLKEHPTWTVHTALEQQRQRFEFVIAHLGTYPQDVPAHYLFPSDDEFLDCFPWKPKD